MDIKENITGLQHIGIPSADLHASRAFYEKLGFECIFTTRFDDNGSENEVVFMHKGNLTLEIYGTKEPALKAGAVDHIALNVQDIEAAFDAISAMQLNNTRDSIHYLPFFAHGVKFFTIEGPSKEKVEFNQFLD